MRTRIALVALPVIMALSVLAAPLASAYDGEYFRVCRLNPYGDNYLSLRTCPSTRCREITRMGPGTEVVSINPYPRRRWWEIEILDANGMRTGIAGWAYGGYLCPE
jgi:hypothetical protein